MQHEAAPAGRGALSAALAWAFAGLGAVLAVALVLLRGSDLAAVPVAVMGVGAVVAAVTGSRRNRPHVPRPWLLFALASASFIGGAVLRQVLVGGPVSWFADVATMSGYAMLLAAFAGLLATRQGTGRRVHELVDGAIVLVSVGSVALVLLALPTVAHLGLSVGALVAGAYPVVDTVIVFLAVLLSWTSANRTVSFWLLGFATICVLVGDIGYAVIGTQGRTVGSPLLDLPFVLGFAAFGAAALHPSMRELSAVQQRPVPEWSRSRLALLLPMMALPAGLSLVGSGPADLVGAVAGLLVTALLLLRALSAVRDHARAQEGLRHQATHDSLTELANRSHLVDVVDVLLTRAKQDGDSIDVLFLDVDAFKLVNDTWGHHTGDRVLRLVAQRLREVVDPSDLVARIGGDEFVLVRYVGAGSVTGAQLAASVVEAFREPLPGETDLVTTVSVGLAGSRAGTGSMGRPSAESLLRDADTAMYQAKAAGRDRCMVFDPSMHDAVRRRVETELALRYAIDRGELLLHYQPIVAVGSGEVVGAEALLRWAHPSMGLVPPLDFVPIAEETGLIVEIGRWVVTEAVRQAAQWQRSRTGAGLAPLWMSVNVSPRQLRDPGLAEHVAAELARHGLPPELLVLEITESAMMVDETAAAALLHELRDLGLELAVDDFGTGHSSLGHLRRFPVSKVKIDRAFVAGIALDPDDAEIVRAVVAMSLAMRLVVVAEGIETEEQRQHLDQLGVQLGQGWLFGRPEPAEDCAFVLGQDLAKSYPM